jgi:hypothetical protein
VHNSAGSELGRFDQKINLVQAYLQVVDPGFSRLGHDTFYRFSATFDCRLGAGRPDSDFFQYFWCSHIDTISLWRLWDDVNRELRATCAASTSA